MLLQAGIVRPSLSPWTSPVLPVKKDGIIRFCVNFRKLNTVTVPDPYKMSRVDDIIDRLGEAMFLSKPDLAKGFFQIPVKPKDIEKTAFLTHILQNRCVFFGNYSLFLRICQETIH